MADTIPPEQSQRKKCEHYCKLGIDRAIERLNDGMVDHLFVFHPAVNVCVLAYAIEYNDGIVNRETDNGQNGSEKK